MAKKSTTQCPICGSHYWEYTDLRNLADINPKYSQPTAECSNCCYTRNWTPRGNNGKITASQEAKIARIKRYFTQQLLGHFATPEECSKVEFNDYEQTLESNGNVYIKLSIGTNIYTKQGLSGSIGRRGHLKVYTSLGLSKVYTPKLYERHLNGRGY